MTNKRSECSLASHRSTYVLYITRLRNAWRSPVNQTIEEAELKKQQQVHAYLTDYRTPLTLVGLHAIVVVGPQ